MHQVCTPVIYASNKMVSAHRKHLNLTDFQYTTIKNSNEIILRKTNVVNCWEEEVQIDFGQSNENGGKYALLSLQHAVADLKDKKIDVLITAPINKNNIQSSEFKFNGHTEYLAEEFATKDYLMFLVSDNLKVAVVSGHVPVKDVAAGLSIDKIVAKIKKINHSLKRDFGYRRPKIAVLGLNPHAGDDGLIGKEENEIINPAIKKCYDEGIFAFGAYSADGFFGSGTHRKFDAVLAMYHDQGLVPFKTLSFSNGVNFTAGLPIVRTSPDHGTAYDIAGKGVADEQSFREAIYTAIDVLAKREEYDHINASPLAFSKQTADR
jgi:4-hydroxythreonine-4-phosphate dehydrogenase